MTVGSDWEEERQHHQGACEPCCGGGRLGCAVVGSQREVGSGNGLSDDRVEGTREKAEMYGRPLSLGPKPWPVKS